MDHCTFRKGKKRSIKDGGCQGARNGGESHQLRTFNRRWARFEKDVDSSLAALHSNVLSDISNFVLSHWDPKCPQREVATGVIQCGCAEAVRLEDYLGETLGARPFCVSLPLPQLSTIVQYLRQDGDKKCILMNQIECMPADFVDKLVAVVCEAGEKGVERQFSNSFNVDTRVVLLVKVVADLNALCSRCSRENFTRLVLESFVFPSPEEILDAFLNVVTFNPKTEFKVDGALLEMLKNKFMDEMFSVHDLKKIAKLSILSLSEDANENGQSLPTNECSEFISRYAKFIGLLYDLTNGFPTRASSIYELHEMVQSNVQFFTDKGSSFSFWKALWLTWNVDEMIEALEKMSVSVKEFSDEMGGALEKLIVDLQNVEARNEKVKENLDAEKSRDPFATSKEKGKISHLVMQKRMREKMEWSKRFDVINGDRQNFVRLLTKIFSKTLLPFEKVQSLRGRLLRLTPQISKLTSPFVAEFLEGSLMRPKLLIKPSREQLDLRIAYQSVQHLSQQCKAVSIDEWAAHFGAQIEQLPAGCISSRLFKCIGELELLGVVKASDSTSLSVQVLQIPCTVVV